MQVAALLSDLNSLSVCPPEAAVALVSVHKSQIAEEGDVVLDGTQSSELNRTTTADSINTDPDLKRVNKLISLHHDVKVKHLQSGHDNELLQARQDVAKVIAIMNKAQ